MNKQQQETLGGLLGVLSSAGTTFEELPSDAHFFKESAVLAALEHNSLLYQRQLDEIAAIVKMKLPYLNELEHLGKMLEKRLAECRKEGERTTVPTETAHPKRDKVS